MEWIIFPILIAAVLVWKAAYGIPTAGFAQPTWIGGRRAKRVLGDGLRFVVPFLQQVPDDHVFSRKPRELPINFSFFTCDPKSEVRRELDFSALVLYRDDPNIMTDEGYLRRTEITDKILTDGLTADIKSVVGRFGGLHSWDVFIKNWKGIECYLNGVLRLVKPPHVRPHEILRYLPEDWSGDEVPVLEIPWEDRLEFYKTFSAPIGDLLRDELKYPEWKPSEEEKSFGIDIISLSIHNVDFSPESKQAIEEEGRAVDRISAAEALHEAKVEMLGSYTEKGLESRDALDAAERDLGQINKTETHRVQGLEGLRSIIGGR